MNKQEIFDAVAIGIRAQGGPAMHDGSCAYRTPTGRKCAAGLLIKDENYRSDFEVFTVLSLGDLALPGFGRAETLFLHTLQQAHDSSAIQGPSKSTDAEFFAAWRPQMIEIAEREELSQLALLIDIEAGKDLLRIREERA